MNPGSLGHPYSSILRDLGHLRISTCDRTLNLLRLWARLQVCHVAIRFSASIVCFRWSTLVRWQGAEIARLQGWRQLHPLPPVPPLGCTAGNYLFYFAEEARCTTFPDQCRPYALHFKPQARVRQPPSRAQRLALRGTRTGSL